MRRHLLYLWVALPYLSFYDHFNVTPVKYSHNAKNKEDPNLYSLFRQKMTANNRILGLGGPYVQGPGGTDGDLSVGRWRSGHKILKIFNTWGMWWIFSEIGNRAPPLVGTPITYNYRQA